jgi:hypothetical protein
MPQWASGSESAVSMAYYEETAKLGSQHCGVVNHVLISHAIVRNEMNKISCFKCQKVIKEVSCFAAYSGASPEAARHALTKLR